MLDGCRILADRLAEAPEGKLRALFDALKLDLVHEPADSAVDVAVTLHDGGENAADGRVQVRAKDWSVPPTGFEPVLPP